MITEDDILASLESDETAFSDSKFNSANNVKKKSKGSNLWEKNDFKPMKIDPETFKKTGKTFSIGFYKPGKDVQEDVLEKFIKIATVLSSRGYVFRYNGTHDDKLQNEIMGISGMISETYLAWKSINKNISTPTLTYPIELAYNISASLHKSFSKLPPNARAIFASKVHSLLGKECNNPSDILLAYNDNGDESITKDTDYKKLGYLSFSLNIAKAAGIPVFNLYNENAIPRLVNLLKTSTEENTKQIEVSDGLEQI